MDASSTVALLVYFLGLGLCLWRFPKADRWHAVLCGIAAILWTGMLVFQPETRQPPFVAGTAFLFMFTLGQRLKRSEQ